MSRARHKSGGMSGAPKAADAGGEPQVIAEAEKKKGGGKIHGVKAKYGLHRPGRKMGGRVGANRSPLSTAHKGS